MAASNTVRKPAVADRFYPGQQVELSSLVDRLLTDAAAAGGPVPKAVIAPHAGFMFSGGVAATAYRQLAPAASEVERVIILGPAHFVPIEGLAAHSASHFATPLGDVPVDREALEAALALPEVHVDDRAHAREHSLETQLPFIQRVLGNVAIVPLVVGRATPAQVAQVLGALWGGPETVIAISSDLSHFHPDPEARRLDRSTASTIEALQGEALGPDNACGFLPIAGLLGNAQPSKAHVTTLDLRTSADAGAPADSVVGYGAFTFTQGQA